MESICSKCGKKIEEDFNFCPYCGIPIFDTQTDENINFPKEVCYEIGINMPEGEYQLLALNEEQGGYYKISSDANGQEIIAHETFANNTYITIKEKQFLRLCNCIAIPAPMNEDKNHNGEEQNNLISECDDESFDADNNNNCIDDYNCDESELYVLDNEHEDYSSEYDNYYNEDYDYLVSESEDGEYDWDEIYDYYYDDDGI